MCRNIWTTNIEYEIFDAFGRDHLRSGSLLDEELILAQDSMKNHHRFFSVKLSDIISDEVAATYDNAVRNFCSDSESDIVYNYIEGSSIGDYYLNVMMYLEKYPSEDCDKKALRYTVSVEFRADPDDPESVCGDEYAVFERVFGSANYYAPAERSRMIAEAREDMSRTLSAEYVEHWLLNTIDTIPANTLALQAMIDES